MTFVDQFGNKSAGELIRAELWNKLMSALDDLATSVNTQLATLESEVTVIDPKTYKQPWATQKAVTKLVPGAEIGEEFCVPSDYSSFNDDYSTISGSKKK